MTGPSEQLIRLGRPVEWSYPTNRAIALGCAGIFAAVMVWLLSGVGEGFVEASLHALSVAIATFLAWALAREIAPDAERAAFAAAALGAFAGVARLGALGPEWLGPAPDVATLFWLLLVTRLVNRTVGREPGWPDSGVVMGLTLHGVWEGRMEVAMVATVAFAVDALATRPVRRHFGFAAVTLILAVIEISGRGFGRVAPTGSELLQVFSCGLAGAAFLRWVFDSSVLARGDGDGEPLDRLRLAASRAVYLFALSALAWRSGEAGIVALAPGWAALAGVVPWPARR